jgi:hypothetical protein
MQIGSPQPTRGHRQSYSPRQYAAGLQNRDGSRKDEPRSDGGVFRVLRRRAPTPSKPA